MKLVRDIIVAVVVWILVVFFLTAIVLIPDEIPEIHYELEYLDRVDQYIIDKRSVDWGDYKDRVVDFYSTMIKEKSLGLTIHKESAWETFKYYSNMSLRIVIPSLILSFLIGLWKGIYDFRKFRKRTSIFGHRFTNFFLAVPDFFIILATQVIVIYAIKIGILPYMKLFGNEHPSNYFFAILFLTIYPTFYIAKITTTSLNEEAGNDYIRTAMSKGTPQKRIVNRHMLSNVWLKVSSQLTTMTLYLLSNLFIVEYILMYNGAAYRFYMAIANPRGMDASLVFVFIIFFTGIVLIAQIISKIISFRFLSKEGATL
ncbi:ABC transporter permease subunit [Bacillaceae bacterium W0354]